MARKKSVRKQTHLVLGHWRITWMDQWDQEYVDAEMEGFFEFLPHGRGEFHFGYVHGVIDYRETARDGDACVEFSWEGNDEMDPATGRGWACVEGGELGGQVFFHQGDESHFTAMKAKP